VSAGLRAELKRHPSSQMPRGSCQPADQNRSGIAYAAPRNEALLDAYLHVGKPKKVRRKSTVGMTWVRHETTRPTTNEGLMTTKRRTKKPTGPRILFVDIETSPILAHVWGLFDQNVGLNQIEADWHILAFAAKWAGDAPSKTIYQDQSKVKNMEDDTALLRTLWKLLNEADIIVTQNGKSFDQKKINARFVLQGFKPPSTFKHIDTLLIAKRHFGFTSKKLEYMSGKLNTKYKKLKHEEFSGFELWKECLAGNKRAWKCMRQYNIHDVLALEELYEKLLPWADDAPNFNLYSDSTEHVCRCGSTEHKLQGFAYTSSGRFQRYKCKSCGAESRGKVNLFSKEKKASLRMNVTR
jgi:hypothetical protein